MVHVRAGTLSTDDSLRQRPHQQIISRYVDLVMPTAVVQWPSAVLNTPALRAILPAKSYSAFLHEPYTDADPVELMGAIASFYTNILDPQVSRDRQLANAFRAAGINLEFRRFNSPADVYALLEDPKVQQFLTHCRRATQKCVIALPCVVDGSRISTFSYTSCTCVCKLVWLTFRAKFIDSLKQDAWV
jgi:hypothetical protein